MTWITTFLENSLPSLLDGLGHTSKAVGTKAHNIIYINSPPQTQGGCETSLRLSTKSRVRLLGSGLVKISGS